MDTKVPVRAESQTSPYVCRCQKGQCQKESVCNYGHTPECSHNKSKSGCTWSKASEDKSGNAVVAFKKEKDCQGDAFSARSRRSDGHQQSNNSECDAVATRKDTSVQEKQKNLHWVNISVDERMIAIRTPLLMRICINKGPALTKNHQQQQRDCTNMFTKSAGRTKKKKRTRHSKQRLL